MSLTPDDLLARLREGRSPATVLTLMLADDDAELTKRAAVPRRLDEEVLGVVLEPSADAAVALRRLRELRLVERVLGPGGFVCLRDDVRAENLARWWRDSEDRSAVPLELRDLSSRLAKHFDERGLPVEALYHQLSAAPDEAADRFTELFEAADEALNLARCQQLVATLEQSVDHLPPALQRLASRSAARLAARSRWIDDWYSSARFLELTESGDLLERLVAGEISVLELRARGGMGKTMHLRWLVARRCVPHDVACARIDFDDVDTAAAVQSPWLLLLDVAEQIGPQLPVDPFKGLVRQVGDQLPRLYPNRGVEAPLPLSIDEDERIGKLVRGLFYAGAARIDRTWIVILDTVEVPLLRLPESGTASLSLLDPVAEIARLPSSRVVFASRNAVESRAANFGSLFPGAHSLELTGFELAERRRYLRERRGITDPAMVEAAARVAGRVPLKLALVADVVTAPPKLTPDELAAYEPDLLYLIQRVLERVDKQTRWALRYGAVPRVLDVAFLREVARPYLAQSMAGEKGPDRVSNERLPDDRSAAEVLEPGIIAGEDELDIDTIWAGLRQYAGDSSWVSVPRRQPDQLRLHGDVVLPMRGWLANQRDLFDSLQDDACQWFEERERREPAQAAAWACEAVFHRFQREGPAAATYWRKRIRSASRPEAAELRRALAQDLFGPDYVDERGAVAWYRGGAIVEAATLHEARFEAAWANIQIARTHRLPATAARWREARDALAAAENFADPRGSATTEGRLAMARTALAEVDGDRDEAREQFRRALRGWRAADDLSWLSLEYGPEYAGEVLRGVVGAGVLNLLGWIDGDRRRYWRRSEQDAAARHDAHRDRIDGALEHFDYAQTVAGAAQREETLQAVASLRLRTGENARALHLLDEHRMPIDRLLRARARLRRLEAGEALGELDHVRRDPSAQATTLEAARLEAEAAELGGRAYAGLLDVGPALQSLVQAADLWGAAGVPEGTARSHARRAAFLLRSIGDVRDAEIALAAADRAGAEPGSAAWTKICLLRGQIAARKLDHDAAALTLAATVDLLVKVDAPPRRLVTTAITALAVVPQKGRDEAAKVLLEALDHVSPEGARLTLLARLRRVPTFDGVGRRRLAKLRRRVPSARHPAFRGLDDRDRAILLLADAELDRLLGDRGAALGKLADACAALASDIGGVGLRAWLEAVGRLGGEARLVESVRAIIEKRLAGADLATGMRGALAVAYGRAMGAGLDERASTVLVDVAPRVATARGGGHWEAGLLELRAAASRRADEQEAAEQHARHAARIYQQLGDLAARDRAFDASLDTGELRPPPPGGAADVAVGFSGERFQVEVCAGAGVAPRPAPAYPLLAGVAAPDAGGLTAVLPDGLVRAVVERRAELAAWLGAVLGADGVLEDAMTAGDTRDVRIRLRAPALEVLPWELAAAPAAEPLAGHSGLRTVYRGPGADTVDVVEMRSVQAGLRKAGLEVTEDGTLGASTTAALVGFQRDHDLEPTGAVDPVTVQRLQALLCPGRTVTIVRASTARALGAATAFVTPIERLYTAFGFDVQTLESPRLDEAVDALSRRPTTIVHLTAPLVEAAGSAALDVAGVAAARAGRYGGPSGWLTAAALDRAFQGPVPAPIVVLDPPRPVSEVELAVQLLLRNAFAGELFALGTTRAIFGAGLAPLDASERKSAELVGALAGGARLGDVVAAARTHPDDGVATLHTRSADLLPPW